MNSHRDELRLPGISKLLIIAAIICGVLWATTQDSVEEQREAAHYTDMVCAKQWPDFKHRKPVCGTDD